MSLTLLKNGFYLHLNSLKGVGCLGSAPDPPIAKESGPQAACSQWAPKELKMVLTQFKNVFYSHPNAPKSVGGWGSGRPRPPPIAMESVFGACHFDTSS